MPLPSLAFSPWSSSPDGEFLWPCDQENSESICSSLATLGKVLKSRKLHLRILQTSLSSQGSEGFAIPLVSRSTQVTQDPLPSFQRDHSSGRSCCWQGPGAGLLLSPEACRKQAPVRNSVQLLPTTQMEGPAMHLPCLREGTGVHWIHCRFWKLNGSWDSPVSSGVTTNIGNKGDKWSTRDKEALEHLKIPSLYQNSITEISLSEEKKSWSK